MTSAHIVKIARLRAGLTQQQLAIRSGHPRETIARWETGVQEPALSTLSDLVEACGLALVTHITKLDTSLDEAVHDQAALTASDRLRLLAPSARANTMRALRWVANASSGAIVIGAVADVLQGAPQRPEDGHVELVAEDVFGIEREMQAAGLTPVETEDRWAQTDPRATWTLPQGGTIVVASDVPGTKGYGDLRRSARQVTLVSDSEVEVAHPRDLLRIAEASPREAERARAPALRALLRHEGTT
jgi:transcriptional regulator with XRE-family HTH domain